MPWKSYDIVGYVDNCNILCPNCAESLLTKDQLNKASPIFADEEWEYIPCCDQCGDVIECYALVPTPQAIEDAYDLGKNIGEDIRSLGYLDWENFDWEEFWDGYHQSAEWANDILPELRRIAGFSDSMGVGTYTDGNDALEYVLEELIEKFEEGVEDD